ncbi:DSD1 family PLP-dependent enzyme [Paracoccus sp. S-4012]|uniref:DSD1 family PLP-dependent enzyme n=1 Tax=Paracoccus sp. S-4012 TaxID=2665648 RepID=UPI0018A237F9
MPRIAPGTPEAELPTPCLILDLDALEANLDRMADAARAAGMRLRPHGKMHRSVDLGRAQMARGAVGLCAQTVGEAEVFVAGGIGDVLVTNEVRDPAKLARLATLAAGGARVGLCLDDPAAVAPTGAAAREAGATLDAWIELMCGGRCGVADPAAVAPLAAAIAAEPGLRFAGIHAYEGSAQHLTGDAERGARIATAGERVRAALDALRAAGIDCPQVTGAGTGTWQHEAASGLWTELQCGSYAVMDADYGRIEDPQGQRLDQGWRNALFVLAQVISTPVPGRAVCDAGLKSMSGESGLPLVWGQEGVTATGLSDEHTVLDDPAGALAPGDRLRLIPGHCDPTVNLHDAFVCVRNGVVEAV